MKQEESWENRIDPLFLAQFWEMGSSQISESKLWIWVLVLVLTREKAAFLEIPRELVRLQIQWEALIAKISAYLTTLTIWLYR